MTFHDLLQDCVDAACQEWGYPETTVEAIAGVPDRLPSGLQALIEKGHHKGLITSLGRRFS